MGSLLIELDLKGIEARLLVACCERGRAQRLLLQGAMHSLVSPVLLWMTWLDALVVNTKLHPPDGQAGQAAGSATREWGSVVRANSLGQAELTEDGFKDRLRPHRLR
jgi:hypothetical protein